MAFVVAQEVPTSSSMAVPHGPAGVGQARHCMREELRGNGVSDTVVDDAVLILSELLSNACRHGRPLGRHAEVGDGDIRAAWRMNRAGDLTVEVTDGGGPTRPVPATPSVTARGGRGLNIISALAEKWGSGTTRPARSPSGPWSPRITDARRSRHAPSPWAVRRPAVASGTGCTGCTDAVHWTSWTSPTFSTPSTTRAERPGGRHGGAGPAWVHRQVCPGGDGDG